MSVASETHTSGSESYWRANYVKLSHDLADMGRKFAEEYDRARRLERERDRYKRAMEEVCVEADEADAALREARDLGVVAPADGPLRRAFDKL